MVPALILDTMARTQKRRARYSAAVAGWLLLFSAICQGQISLVERALNQALQQTTAIAVVLDVQTGHLLASAQSREAATLRSAPGSVLKPFFLAEALESQQIQPQSTVLCQRTLTIAGRNVSCTHPQNEAAFDAEQALAYSCNRYFAELAKRLSPEQTTATLRRYGLTEEPHIFTSETSATLQTPMTLEQRELFVLGLEGIKITPAELAVAYRKLALRLEVLPTDSPIHAVSRGLEDSVQYGMAHNAQLLGLSIAGKTGTASNLGQSWTHGWFAGFAPVKSPKIVVVIYLPRGNGADAALLAQKFFIAYKDMPR